MVEVLTQHLAPHGLVGGALHTANRVESSGSSTRAGVQGHYVQQPMLFQKNE